MKVLVCGGRDYGDKMHVWAVLDNWHKRNEIDMIIAGDAKGVDDAALTWAKDRRIRYAEFIADWASHGRAAGPIRNQRMLKEGTPDCVIAFPGGKGTANMCKQAEKAGLMVHKFWAVSR